MDKDKMEAELSEGALKLSIITGNPWVIVVVAIVLVVAFVVM